MDASTYSASIREICRDALEKSNKSSEGRCVLEASHFAGFNRGLERFTTTIDKRRENACRVPSEGRQP